MKANISIKRLHEVLCFDPETGVFTWRESKPRSKFKAGFIAGCLRSNGYVHIKIDGDAYLAHRLAWAYVNGAHPDSFIDHKNRIRNDNRISNLRVVSRSENMQNQAAQANSKTGVKGVSPSSTTGLFVAQIMVNKKKIRLGYFSNIEDAAVSYAKAAASMHTINPSANAL